MLSKLSIQALAFLLVALPLLGVLGKESLAAESSRVAIISQLSGDVQVQKSGGSKKIRAFKKLNLNQGDMLYTGSKSSATLQFSNGTSSDDTMTVAANATLKFSKLSSNGSTITKVSMLKGSAWVDVKSIKSKDDKFQVETPTAIMGVRGTNFLVVVNPITGSTNTSVFAGAVQLDAPSGKQPASDNPNPGTVLIYPTNQIDVAPSIPSGQLTDQVSMVNLPELTSSLTPELIQAILLSYGKINEENRQFIDSLKNGTQSLPPVLGTDIQTVEDNLVNLIGATLQQALSNHAITQDQLNSLIQQIEQSQGKKLDLPSKELTLTDLQKKKQEELEKKEKMLAAQEAEKRKQQLAEQQKQLELLAQQKKEQDARNQAEADRLRKEAEAKLLAGMTEHQKKDYLTNQSNLNGTPPPSSSSSSESSSSNSDKGKLTGLTLLGDGVQLSPNFSKNVYSYSVNVGEDFNSEIGVFPTAASTATVTIAVNGIVQEGGSSTSFQPSPDQTMTQVTITVKDGTVTKTYTINFRRQMPGVTSWSTRANGAEVSWNLAGSAGTDYSEGRLYQMYFDEIPSTFQVDFSFDDTVIFDKELNPAVNYDEGKRKGSFIFTQDLWHTGPNDVTIYYQIGEGETSKEYYVHFTVYIGAPELEGIEGWNFENTDDVPIYEVGDHQFAGSMFVDYERDSYPLAFYVYTGTEGESNVEIQMGDEDIGYDGAYIAYLTPGWNDLQITVLNPVPGGTNGYYELMIWVDSGLPAELGLDSIGVTNGSASPSEYEGATPLEWDAYVNDLEDGKAYIDPVASTGSSIVGVHYEDYDSGDYFAEAHQEAGGDYAGQYAIPLSGDTSVYVTVKNEDGRYLTYRISLQEALA